MKSFSFKKFILIILIFPLIFSSSGIIFVKKVNALTVGEAAGKAIGAGVACFIEMKTLNTAQGTVDEIAANAPTTLKLLPAIAAEAAALGLETASLVANVPVVDPAVFAELGAVALVNAAILHSSEAAKLKKDSNESLNHARDCIRDVIVKIILDWMVDQTVEWIQGGGSPKFVTDWDTFLSDAFNVGVGEVIYNSENFRFLCSPFGAQLQVTLLPVQRFSLQVRCTLDQITGNIENFYDNFSNGGWLAYSAMWQPQNNYYGSLLMFHDEALARGLAKQKAAEDEALAGKGFLSVKKRICVEYSTEPVPTSEGPAVVQCIKYKDIVQTPGAAVGDVVAKSITSDIDWAANVKSWVAALTNAIINRLIQQGLSSMSSSFTSVDGGDYSELPIYVNSQLIASSSAIIADANSNTNPSLIQGVDDLINYYEIIRGQVVGVLDLENTVSSTLKQIRGVLSQLTANNCTIPSGVIGTNEINIRLGEVGNDITHFQGIIDEIDEKIAEINGYENPSVDEFISLVNEYRDFVRRSDISGIIGGATITVINNRLLDNRDYHLRRAQQALASCGISSSGGSGGLNGYTGGGGGGGN